MPCSFFYNCFDIKDISSYFFVPEYTHMYMDRKEKIAYKNFCNESDRLNIENKNSLQLYNLWCTLSYQQKKLWYY